MTVALTRQDIEQIIKDELGAVAAAGVIDRSRENSEKGAKALRDGTVTLEDVIAAAGRQRAVVDEDSGKVLSDPFKGKGLRFARMVKALAAARLEGKPAEQLAESWVKQGFKQYEGIAEQIRAADEQKRALSDMTLATGGALVPPAFASEIIELLYAQTLALKLGARTLDFPGQLEMGKVNSGATVYYVGEAQNITPSQPAFGSLKLSRKKAAAIVPMTNELLRNPAVGADAIVRDDLLMQLALRRDLSIFRGQGTENQPKGIKNAIASGNSNGTNGTSLAQKLSDLATAMRVVIESNVPLLAGGWAMAPRSFLALMFTLDSQGKFVFKDEMAAGTLLGYRFGHTTQIPTNISGSLSEVYFGAFNDLIVGFDSTCPLAIEVFPNGTFYDGSNLVSGVSSDQSVVRALEGHDVLLRHNTAFSMVTSVAWTT
jgi:HK97 family phage major capsid protein